jgi:hypothetical protein
MGKLSAVDIHLQPLDVLVERLVKISKKGGTPYTHTHTHTHTTTTYIQYPQTLVANGGLNRFDLVIRRLSAQQKSV